MDQSRDQLKETFKNKKLALKVIFMFFISFFILSAIINYIDIVTIKELLTKVDIFYYFLCFIIFFIISYLTCIRFASAIEISGYKLNKLKSWSYVLAVHPLNLFIPSKGGELWKAYLLRKKVKYSSTIGCVIIEKLFDVLALCLIGMIGSTLVENHISNFVFLFIILLVLIIIKYIGLLTLPFGGKLIEKISNVQNTFKILIKKPILMFRLLTSSLFIWLSFALMIHFLFKGINYNTNFSYIMVVYPLSIIIGLIPITIGGLGTRDTAFLYFFNIYDVPQEASIIVSLSYFIFSYILPSIIGFPFTIYYFFRSK